MHAGNAGFLDGLGHQRMRQTAELEVELESSNALFRAGDFAVHVAVMIFPTDDVGEELIPRNFLVGAKFGADADADAGDGTNHWNAGVHERERAAADAG